MSHYQERMENDLAEIRQAVESMAVSVQQAMRDAIASLLRDDEELASLTIIRDNPINRASRELDRLCHAFIARHLPSAGHLRLMSSTIRVNVALERIGDYAVTICREGRQLPAKPSGVVASALDRLSDEVKQILAESVECFISGNGERARAVIPRAGRVEDMMDSIYADFFQTEAPGDARAVVAAFVVFSLLKRVSDQSKNICEQTVFAVTGLSKPRRRVRILFVDDTSSRLAPMAMAIARKSYPESGEYMAVAKDPAAEVDPDLLTFLDERGIDGSTLTPVGISSVEHDLTEFNLIISLEGKPRDYFPSVPFHTNSVTWDADRDGADLESIYRSLKSELDSLMQVLVGDDAD